MRSTTLLGKFIRKVAFSGPLNRIFSSGLQAQSTRARGHEGPLGAVFLKVFFRGPEPSRRTGPLTERSKTHGPMDWGVWLALGTQNTDDTEHRKSGQARNTEHRTQTLLEHRNTDHTNRTIGGQLGGG
jgi:hypothetical protein